MRCTIPSFPLVASGEWMGEDVDADDFCVDEVNLLIRAVFR